MSDTWHHSKKAGQFKPRARTRWLVYSYTYWAYWPRPAYLKTRTCVNIQTVPAWYRRMHNRLYRSRVKREVARHGEVRTSFPLNGNGYDYW